MSEQDALELIRIRLDIADAAVADRLAALLAGIPGLRLVGPGEAADAALVLPATAVGLDGEVLLSPREFEVLALLAEGASNKEIARSLRIASATVKNNVHNILEKMQVSRRGAVAAILRGGS